MKRRIYLQNAILLILSTGVAVVLLEIGLRLFTPFPITLITNKAVDSRLAYTLDPALEDVDERGFRNAEYKLEEADLVVIGDSHTYGTNVHSEHSFPSILARNTGRKVYNLGVGSYGIYQYKVLIDDMPQYSVREVILALYPANDLDMHCNVLRTKFWRKYIEDTELSVPYCKKPTKQPMTVKRILGGLGRRLSETATLQIIKNLLQNTSWGGFDDEKYYWFDENQFVSKRRVRLHAEHTNLDDPDIRINFENSKKFLVESKEKLANASVGFVVVIIPSKQRVLYEWMKGRNRDIPAEFENLVMNENFIAREYKSFFEANDIEFLDALSDVVVGLEKSLEEGSVFYKPGNSHPYRPGYQAYADAAAKALERISKSKN